MKTAENLEDDDTWAIRSHDPSIILSILGHTIKITMHGDISELESKSS